MAGFFPIFFRNYWSVDQESSAITLRLGIANSVASLLIVLLAPLLGAVADQAGARKRFLMAFCALGVVMTALLCVVKPGDWLTAAMVYCAATFGFMGGNVFYDAMIVSVTRPARYDWVSALGYALGYLGGGLLFACCVIMTLNPGAFGFSDAAGAVRASFVLVSFWWGLFATPLFMVVPSSRGGALTAAAVTAGWRQLVDTLRDIRRLKVVWVFLIAYWLYIDGVDTIARMAIDYGLALGFDSNDLIIALLITQFVGFPAALVFGKVGGIIGAKRGIFIAIGIYMLATCWGAFMNEAWEFYALAVTIGLVQGGIQALSRALYARLIPPVHAAQFFGFYNMMGKFAAVLGPAMVGGVGVLTGNPRAGLLSILLLFAAGAVLLSRVDVPAPTTEPGNSSPHIAT